jgi:protein-tyrosine phosphatase
MIDWHSHILPGIDDGPENTGQALAMAASLAGAGFTKVYCTPHLIRGCYDATNDEVCRAVAELQERLNAIDIPLTLFAGREYCLDEYLLTALQTPLPLGDSRLVLVEIPAQISCDMARNLIYGVVLSGFTPVIAHPERCPLLALPVRRTANTGILGSISSLLISNRNNGAQQARPGASGNQLLDYLHGLGCSFQGNLGSFRGFYGHQVKAAAEALQQLGIYDRYGSDLHTPEQAKLVLGGVLPH